jgi:hypothetical protein
MAVMIVDQMQGFTRETYDQMAQQLINPLRQSKGFIAHAAGPLDDGWQVTEIWETQEDHDSWFEQNVKPNLPPDATPPKTTVFQIHRVEVK